MRVMVYDPFVDKNIIESLEEKIEDLNLAFKSADFLSSYAFKY